MLLIVLEMTRFVFLLCLSQFQSVTYFAGLKELYIYLDIHVVGGKDWSFKIVVEKNNAKDKWQLIKGCGSFFGEVD